jgi:hypothetical protein
VYFILFIEYNNQTSFARIEYVLSDKQHKIEKSHFLTEHFLIAMIFLLNIMIVIIFIEYPCNN